MPAFSAIAVVVAAWSLSGRRSDRDRVSVFRRLYGAAIRRAGDSLEHPRRLLRLCEFRLGGILRRSAPIPRWRWTNSAVRSTNGSTKDACRRPAHDFSAADPGAHDLFGGMISGLIGLGTGYLTLRLRGAFFAIATLALAVVLQTLIVNWDFVGGSRGAYIIRPENASDHRQLRGISVPDHAGAGRDRDRRRPRDRALAARLRLRHHPRRRSWPPKPPACRPCG